MELPVKYDDLNWDEKRNVRLQYVVKQNGLCYFCKDTLDKPAVQTNEIVTIDRGLFPPTFFQHPVHLHHCHKTGMTLGAVHCHCNAVLWQFHGE